MDNINESEREKSYSRAWETPPALRATSPIRRRSFPAADKLFAATDFKSVAGMAVWLSPHANPCGEMLYMVVRKKWVGKMTNGNPVRMRCFRSSRPLGTNTQISRGVFPFVSRGG